MKALFIDLMIEESLIEQQNAGYVMSHLES